VLVRTDPAVTDSTDGASIATATSAQSAVQQQCENTAADTSLPSPPSLVVPPLPPVFLDFDSLANGAYMIDNDEGLSSSISGHGYMLVLTNIRDIGAVFRASIQVTPNRQNLLDLVLNLSASLVNQVIGRDSLDMVREFSISDFHFAERQANMASMSKRIHHFSQFIPDLELQFRNAHKIQKISSKIEVIRHFMSDATISLLPGFKQRLSVMRLLGYVDSEMGVISLKGTVACALNTCDEILGTE
jgi:hypothetical protein